MGQSKECSYLFQVIIVPIWKKGDEKASVLEAVDSVQKVLKEAGIRVKVDDSELRTPGWKFNHYEMKVSASTLIVEIQFFVLFTHLLLPYLDLYAFITSEMP